jgi:hypothetical protein
MAHLTKRNPLGETGGATADTIDNGDFLGDVGGLVDHSVEVVFAITY